MKVSDSMGQQEPNRYQKTPAQVHNHASHQVTKCMHDHTGIKKSEGMMGSASLNSAAAEQTQGNVLTQESLTPEGLLQRLFRQGSRLWGHIWGETPGAAAREEKRADGKGSEADDARRAAALQKPERVSVDRQREQAEQMNPYFVVAQEQDHPKGLTGRFRMTVETVSGFLAKHFPFAQTGSFQAKQQQTKEEDLRKKSRYRKDDLEIDCVLTDDSYLLDSYDSKGEYRKLTAEK